VLAGGNDSSSSADSLLEMFAWTPASGSSSSTMPPGMGFGGSAGASDPKKALLGMCLIILSQVGAAALVQDAGITLHYITCSTQPRVVNPIQEPARGSLGEPARGSLGALHAAQTWKKTVNGKKALLEMCLIILSQVGIAGASTLYARG
jgi:hypothetical protein